MLRVYQVTFTMPNGEKHTQEFRTRQNAVLYLNRAVLDYGRTDAKLKTRTYKTMVDIASEV